MKLFVAWIVVTAVTAAIFWRVIALAVKCGAVGLVDMECLYCLAWPFKPWMWLLGFDSDIPGPPDFEPTFARFLCLIIGMFSSVALAIFTVGAWFHMFYSLFDWAGK